MLLTTNTLIRSLNVSWLLWRCSIGRHESASNDWSCLINSWSWKQTHKIHGYNLKVCHPHGVRSVIQSCSVYIYIHAVMKHNNITISSNKQYTATCFGTVCRPSLGCPENLSDYTVCLVLLLEDGRDLVLQHESWKL